eukprot:TRINITY_DN44887_c0_g1_i1.p1 TRINITY_DN44887_c0_g1~~TRINITY_DN44887_c0_g1_i1.p1  ORF type:complete len:278 (+),score=50.65 TRINITY_DN44887_c0_g1_i1:61-834(+)
MVVDSKATLQRGALLCREERFALAAELYQEVIEELCSHRDEEEKDCDRSSLAAARLGLATCALRTGEGVDAAIAECTALLETDATNVQALFRRGMLRRKLRRADKLQLEAARTDLAAAARLQPSNPRMRAALAKVEEELQAATPHSAAGYASHCEPKNSGEVWAAERSAWLQPARAAGYVLERQQASCMELQQEDVEALQAVLAAVVAPYPALTKPLSLRAVVRCAAELWPALHDQGQAPVIGPQGPPSGSDWMPVA